MNTGRTKAPLINFIEVNPRETIDKGHLSKKIGMDKLQPFCRDIQEYEIAEFNGGAKFRNSDTIMARITPCLENGKIAMVNVLDENEVGFGSTEYIVFRAKKGLTIPDFVYYLVSSSIDVYKRQTVLNRSGYGDYATHCTDTTYEEYDMFTGFYMQFIWNDDIQKFYYIDMDKVKTTSDFTETLTP